MIQAPNLPPWAALLVGLLLLSGASITLLGTIGLVSLKSIYERMHAISMGATLGAICILLASIVSFSVMQNRPVIHEILIFLFVTITTPVTMMLVSRAAIYRDRIEGDNNVPPDFAPVNDDKNDEYRPLP